MSGQLRLLASIAARHLVGRRRQTLVAVSGVAVGVGFFLAVSAMMIGSQNDFIKTLIDAAPHILVCSGAGGGPAGDPQGSGTVAVRHWEVPEKGRRSAGRSFC